MHFINRLKVFNWWTGDATRMRASSRPAAPDVNAAGGPREAKQQLRSSVPQRRRGREISQRQLRVNETSTAEVGQLHITAVYNHNTHTDIHRHTHTYRHTQRHTQTQTPIDTQTSTDKQTYTDRDRDIYTHTPTDTHTHTYTDTYTHWQTHKTELRVYVPLETFRRRSSQQISWLSTGETKSNTTKANNTRT